MRVKIPKNVGEENFVNHVIHYGKLKRWAYKKALSIKHGSSDIDLEIYHSFYLQNLFRDTSRAQHCVLTPYTKANFGRVSSSFGLLVKWKKFSHQLFKIKKTY